MCPVAVAAQDETESELGWSDTAELSFVATGGNAEGSSFAFELQTPGPVPR